VIKDWWPSIIVRVCATMLEREKKKNEEEE
jgi:hypothetical protein